MILTNYENIVAPLKKIQTKLQNHISQHNARIESLETKKTTIDNSIKESYVEINKSKNTELKIASLLE